MKGALPCRSPLLFFLLVFSLSLPFWLAGALTEFQLLPGVPLSGLMFVCPVAAALILAYRENKTAGMAGLLGRALDFQRIRTKMWYAPILLLMPGVAILQYTWVLWVEGAQLPIPRFSAGATLALSLGFFIAAQGEELGWSGYVIDPMQERWGALPAGILLGAVWAVWHIVPLVQAHRPPVWIAWWCLGTVATRVLIVWLYNNSGKSVFGAAVFHASGNLAWQLFPIHGSCFDFRVNAIIEALLVVIVLVAWGPRSLAGYKKG